MPGSYHGDVHERCGEAVRKQAGRGDRRRERDRPGDRAGVRRQRRPIVAADLDLAAATSVSELIAGRGGAAHARQVDVAVAADMERFANWVRTEVGVPDVVVNNAGIAMVGPLLAHTEEDWQRIVGVNLLGVARGWALRRADGRAGDRRSPGEHRLGRRVRAVGLAAGVRDHQGGGADAQRVPAGRTGQRRHRGDGDLPGVTSTPIARSARYVGVAPGAADQVRENSIRALRRRGFPPEKVALAVMRAVLRDRPVVPVNAEARVLYALSRLAPGTLRALARLEAKHSPLRASR